MSGLTLQQALDELDSLGSHPTPAAIADLVSRISTDQVDGSNPNTHLLYSSDYGGKLSLGHESIGLPHLGDPLTKLDLAFN